MFSSPLRLCLYFPSMKFYEKCLYHFSSLTFFLFFRLLDSSSSFSSSSMAEADQSPSSCLHSSPLSPSFGLEATLSPAHPAFLLLSPADSTTSSSSSFSLHCGIPEPESPTGSNSSGGSLGGDALMSEAPTSFSAPQMGSFSAQVTKVCLKSPKASSEKTFF